MSKYIDSNLINDEMIKYEAKVSKWSLLPEVVLGVVLLPFIIGLYFLARAAIKYFTTELAITNKRVIAKFGLIYRETVELNLSKIEAIRIDQSIFGRIFNFGSIVASGGGNPSAPIPGISNPLDFRKTLFEIQEFFEEKKPKYTSVDYNESSLM